MTDQNQTSSEAQSSEILKELKNLGNNLKELLQTAWESEERKKLQGEIEAGLNDLSKTLTQAANEFAASPTGQTLKSDLEDLHERIRSGEVETQIRSELVEALRAANQGLKKATASQKTTAEHASDEEPEETA